jgi:threonine aldolase
MHFDDRTAKRGCSHFVSGHVPMSLAERFRRMTETVGVDDASDVYGAGGAVATLEARVADLLGKPAALFFAKGMVAQMSALKVHAERAGIDAIALHPQSHFDVDEKDALYRVAGLRPVRVSRFMPFTTNQLNRVEERLAAVSVELPLRRSGYVLPALDEVETISRWCRGREIAFHIDGARVWEAAAAYGCAPDVIAAMSDTIYVSFYKGLGGLGGAVLAGDREVIDAARAWRTRFGGTLYDAAPYALSALDGLDRHLSRMPIYVERARDLASALCTQMPGLVPQAGVPTNAFILRLDATDDDVSRRSLAFARERGIWLFNAIAEGPYPGTSIAEVVVGDGSDHWPAADAVAWLLAFVGRHDAE